MQNSHILPRRGVRGIAAVAAAGAVAVACVAVAQHADAATTRAVDASAKLTLKKVNANGPSRYTGTATGAPFGRGTLVLNGQLIAANPSKGTPARIETTFTLTTARGKVSGRGNAPLRVSGGRFTFSGPVVITKGQGAYAGARAVGLRFSGSAPSLRELTVAFKGRVRY